MNTICQKRTRFNWSINKRNSFFVNQDYDLVKREKKEDFSSWHKLDRNFMIWRTFPDFFFLENSTLIIQLVIVRMSTQFPIDSTSTITQQILSNVTELISHSDNSNSLFRYKTLYRNYHGIISAFVCIFGLTCNLFNIIVLTRPLMRSSTNTILTCLALSDLIKMLFVLPAAILFYCLQPSERKSEPNFTSHFQVTFYMVQMLVALSLHCISTW